MASTSSPYGFVPISHQSGTPRTVRMPAGIASGYAANIFKYQPIKLVAGVIQAVTATTDQIFGIFAGAEFTPSGSRPGEFPYWPTGSTYQVDGSGNPLFDMFVYFWPAWDASLRLQVQATGNVPQSSMGGQFNISAPTAGNTTTGLSAAAVSNTVVTAASQGQFFFSEYFTGVNDSPGDAFTDMIVGVAYNQIGPGFQTSIG